MSKKNKTRLILENRSGQVIRTYRWDRPYMHIVHRNDTRRLEAYADLKDLNEQKIPYQLLKSTSLNEIAAGGVKIPKIGMLKTATGLSKLKFTPSVEIERENSRQFGKILKWTGIGHLALLAIVFISFWVHQSFIQEEETIVKVEPRSVQKIIPKKKRPVVQASKKKIDRTKKVGKKNLKKKIAKKKKNISKVGALAVLGGSTSGRKGGRGLNLKSALNNTGSGNSMGTKSLGKDTVTLPGKGLFARSGGNGKVNKGTVGYGTRGRAGGQAGYGTLNIGGNSGGYDHPIQERGSVEGGLEESQILAVIQRNIGQIIYCYEKGLQKKPKLSGRVSVYFVINGGGRVRTTKVKNTSLGSDSVESCMQKKIRGWKFPRPHGNVDVKVTYPFVLRRAHKR